MGEMIRITAEDGHAFDAYRADPAGAARGGLVVIQEIFGVNHHIRAVCDGFAAAGYRAIAPALFDRFEPGIELGYDEAGIARGREIRPEVGWDGPMRDIAATAALLAKQGKVGTVGYCWGGSLAWLAATRLGLASVGYYGGAIIDFVDEQPKAPVLLHFGEIDTGIPLDDVDKIRATHPEVPIHLYAGAGHGFNCDARGSYHAESAATARNRTLTFFGEQIG